MNNKKRLLAIVLATMMLFCTMAVLAACGNNPKTFDLDWRNYLMDEKEFLKANNAPKLPVVSSGNFGNASVETTNASRGLIVVTEDNSTYGYSIVSGKTFGTTDDLRNLEYNEDYTFIGTKRNGNSVLYDVTGRNVATGSNIVTYTRTVTVDGKTTNYLQISIDNNYSFYLEFLENGSLSDDELTILPTDTDNDNLPSQGEAFKEQPITLSEIFEIDEDEIDDTLDKTYVRLFGRSIAFYNNADKEISRWTRPTNIGTSIYVDGNILFSTLTPVDAMKTDGYNYVDANGNKYDAKLFSFNIKSGKTNELNVDYVLTGKQASLYNKITHAHDVAEIKVCHMTDGVAWSYNADSIVINAKGEVGFSMRDSMYGHPFAKVGNNLITLDLNTNCHIVDVKGNLLATLGEMSSVETMLSDGFVLKRNGKIGVVGFDGKVKVGFTYEKINECRIYGNYVIVRDDVGERYSLNLSTGVATSLKVITSGSVGLTSVYSFGSYYSPDYTLIYTFDPDKRTYDWYNLDGTSIVKNVITANPTYNTMYIFGNKYGFTAMRVATGTGTETLAYIRFKF